MRLLEVPAAAAEICNAAMLPADTPVVYSDTQLSDLELLAAPEPCNTLLGMALREVSEPAVFRHFFAQSLFGQRLHPRD